MIQNTYSNVSMVWPSVYNVHMYSVQCTCTVFTTYPYSWLHRVLSVQTMYTVHCTLYTVHTQTSVYRDCIEHIHCSSGLDFSERAYRDWIQHIVYSDRVVNTPKSVYIVYSDRVLPTYYASDLDFWDFFRRFALPSSQSTRPSNFAVCVVCVCVCVCVYIYIYVCVHMYIHVCMYVQTYSLSYTHTQRNWGGGRERETNASVGRPDVPASEVNHNEWINKIK